MQAGFYRRRGKLEQPVGGRPLAVLQLQTMGFCHSKHLLDDPARLIPADALPSFGGIFDLVRG